MRLTHLLLAAGLMAFAMPAAAQQEPVDVNIIYGAPSSTSWPYWFAKEGGYFEKYGLNATVEFGMHPAGPAAVVSGEALTHNLGLDTAILAAIRGERVVLVGAPLQVGQFVLIGRKEIGTAKELEGKRVAVGRTGDPPHFYGLALLEALGVETDGINWVSAGAPPQRGLAVRNNMADAAMLTPPEFYHLIDEGYSVLGRLQEHREIPIATTYLFRRQTLEQHPEQVEAVFKAYAEAVKRFYEDKEFATGVIKKYTQIEDDAIIGRLYDDVKEGELLERVPYIPRAAIEGVIERNQEETPELATADLSHAIDQSVLDRIVDSGFFEELYGPSINEEIERARAAAFR